MVNTNVFVNNFVNKPPRTLQPWQRMLRLADNAMKIMEKDVELFWGYDNVMKLIENKSVVLSWVYLQPFCSRSGKIVKKFKFLTGEIGEITDNAMKLIENKSVVLSWVYLQPFCSTLQYKITSFSIFNSIFARATKNTSALARVFFSFQLCIVWSISTALNTKCLLFILQTLGVRNNGLK